MVTPLKGDSKLADAGIAHHRGDLEYGLGRSREELRGPGHALLQKILVDWDPINLAETGLQRCACLLYTSPSPRDRQKSRMPSSA